MLIVAYLGVLVAATIVEKALGSELARAMVYETKWFAAMHGLLAANILAAMLVRFPWRWRQSGFFVAHVGILVLLAGCLLTKVWGVDGQLSIYEGQAAHRVVDPASESPRFDLGFQVYLHKFHRRLDPASAVASHYSSVVDFLDRSDPPKKLRENVLITLNAPADFTDPHSGLTYRLFQSRYEGPWTPGEEFDKLIGDDRSRDHLYRTHLTVNYDPGRGAKAFGSLLIVLGMVIVYGQRWFKALRSNGLKESSGVEGCAPSGANGGMVIRGLLAPGGLLVAAMLSGGAAFAGTPESLDWSVWQHLPALGDGRVAPLDTVARQSVEAICGSAAPTLAVGNEPARKYIAAELLFAWLAEPERWENVPFLLAKDATLREDVLGLPLYDAAGNRLRFVSPAQFEKAVRDEAFGRRWAKLRQQAEAEGRAFQSTDAYKKANSLLEAHTRYRWISGRPTNDVSSRFFSRLRLAGAAWINVAGDREAARSVSRDRQVRQSMSELGQLLQKLLVESHSGKAGRDKIEPLAAKFDRTANELAARLSGDRRLTGLAAELSRQAAEMHMAMYDGGPSLRLTPGLSAAALEENRPIDEDASPWLGFQAMIHGSDELLRAYPQAEVKAVRESWNAVRSVYVDRAATDRPARFAAAMERFAAAVGELGNRIEPVRARLPVVERDRSAISATAYPGPQAIDAEVLYNRFDPFFWAWLVSITATASIVAAVGRRQRTLLWLGLALLAFGQAFTIAGLGLRAYITGLAPLTGMFESVVVVSLFVALLAIWLTLLPLLRRNGSAPLPKGGRQGVSPCDTVIGTPRSPHPNPLPKGEGTGVLQRQPFLLAGAIISATAMVLAYYAPATVMHRDIGSAMPILRDNFWLVVHVTTIMMSYAAAAMAMILGNMGLGWYLFGRYMPTGSEGMAPEPTLPSKGTVPFLLGQKSGQSPGEECSTRSVLPTIEPAECKRLAGFAYTAIKVAVVLLTTGTILGGLWADNAWGRFWGWDPKETWALISLLVYMALLHARHAGWSGDFGMCVTAVLGFGAVLFTWYGVNFLISSGMHAYGSGAGGAWPMAAAALLQLGFLAAAGGRYFVSQAASRCNADS
ncbi:MAG: cytochrome c biogenesis protein CcsA [Planctomycetaceae bacterium]|nr:cytochrome c biogenesis protein CcsA [Planctomycetaceae bacterium]